MINCIIFILQFPKDVKLEGKKARNKGTLTTQILIEFLGCKDKECKVPRLNQCGEAMPFLILVNVSLYIHLLMNLMLLLSS